MNAGNGLRQLAFGPQGFRMLRSLLAGRNQLTDSCLPGLAALPHLHRLHLPHNCIQWAARSPHQPLSFAALQVPLSLIHFFCHLSLTCKQTIDHDIHDRV